MAAIHVGKTVRDRCSARCSISRRKSGTGRNRDKRAAGQPVPRARVELPAANVVVFTDIQGAFSVRGIDLSEPRLLNVRKGKLSSSTTVHQYTSALRLYLVAEPVRIHDFARVPAAMEGLFRLQDRNVQGQGRPVVEEFAPRREIAWEPGAPQLEAVQNRKNRMKYDNPAMGPDQKFQGVVVDRWADAGRGDELLEEGLAGKMVPRAELQEMDMALKNVGGKEFNRPPPSLIIAPVSLRRRTTRTPKHLANARLSTGKGIWL